MWKAEGVSEGKDHHLQTLHVYTHVWKYMQQIKHKTSSFTNNLSLKKQYNQTFIHYFHNIVIWENYTHIYMHVCGLQKYSNPLKMCVKKDYVGINCDVMTEWFTECDLNHSSYKNIYFCLNGIKNIGVHYSCTVLDKLRISLFYF